MEAVPLKIMNIFEKYVRMISFIEPATLLKNKLFLSYCSRNLSDDFFHRTAPCIFVINRSSTAFLDNLELY